VVFGHAGPVAAAMSLSTLDGTNGFRLDGVAVDDSAGWSVSGAGDLNSDGYNDIIIGARHADPGGTDSAGSSYVVFGAPNGFASAINLSTLNGSNGFRLDGTAIGDDSGASVSGVGDINGDGIADLAIGAHDADPNGNDSAGSTYVVFGQTAAFPATLDLSALDGTNGFRFDGVATDEQSGFAISDAGDVNGDGFDDLIIGARNAEPNGISDAGSSYVVFGHSGPWAAVTDLIALDGTSGFRLDGVEDDHSGGSVSSAGDLNADGFDDLIVGGISFSVPTPARTTYVMFGRAAGFLPVVSLSSLSAGTGIQLEGMNPSDESGSSVHGAGDVNGDSFDDLIIGASYADPWSVFAAGSSFVVFGGNFTGGVETQVGDAAANTLTANQGSGVIDILAGAQGDDLLISDGGADVLRGGEGDDGLSIPDVDFSSTRRLQGGNGFDTLILAGSGLMLDLTAIPDNRITDVEAIDVRGSGDNTLTLDVREVLNISSHSNTLLVRRENADTVNMGPGWTQQGVEVINSVTYNVYVQGAATLKVETDPAPEVSVTGLNDTNISDGDNRASAADGTNFGNILHGDTPVTRNFTVSNDGGSTLTLGSVSLPTGFTLTEGLDSSIAAGQSDTFTVRLDANVVGTKTGHLTFTTNDSDENPFNFRILGKVLESDGPEIVVEGLNDIEITDGDNTVSAADGTNFGTILRGTTPVSRTFTVTNTGDVPLMLGTISLPTGFTLTEGLDSSIAAGASDTFTVQLDADTNGTKSGHLSFSTNDSDEDPFNFRITGKVQEPTDPEIIVRGFNNVVIEDGDNKVTAADGTNFGSVLEDGTPKTQTFTVINLGDLPLTLGSVSVPTGFTLLDDLSGPLAYGESDTFTIQRDADIVGTKSGHISFSNNDSDESPFNFRITGKVIDVVHPEIRVNGLNGVEILDDDNKASVVDGTNFGSVAQGSGPITRTFTVTNDGVDPLFLGVITIPNGFTLVDGLPSTLAAGASDTFTVQLDTTTTGTKSGHLSFNTNDADERRFNFRILGKVL